MTRAADIARTAYEQALAAAEMERLHEEALKEDERRRKHAAHVAEFEAALPILAKWFPGVEWTWHEEGGYGFDTIITDAAEDWPPSFKLRVNRHLIDMNEPDAGYRVKIEVGDYRSDSQGYSYFSGGEIRSAADVGRYLERKADA